MQSILDNLGIHIRNAIRQTIPTDAENQTLGIFLTKLRTELTHSQIRYDHNQNKLRYNKCDTIYDFDKLVKDITKPRNWFKIGEMHPYAFAQEYNICGYIITKYLIFDIISKLKTEFNTLSLSVSKIEQVPNNQPPMNQTEHTKFDIDLTNEKNSLYTIGNSIKNLQDSVVQAANVKSQMGTVVLNLMLLHNEIQPLHGENNK